jgi:HD-like signal output (HDOD) protein
VQNELEKIKQMVGKGLSFEVAEYIVIGTNHAEIGARILKNWALPQELVNAVSWHHDPERCQNYCMLSDVVHIANILGRMIGYGKGPNGKSIEPSFEVVDRLGLTESQMAKLAEQTLQAVTRLTDLMA